MASIWSSLRTSTRTASAAAPKASRTENPSATPVRPTAPATSLADPAPRAGKKGATTSRDGDFRPALQSKRPEDRIDPLTVDPTLRTDLLAKVQSVEPEGGLRNLFQFGAAQPKEELKGPEKKIEVVAKMVDYPRPLPPPTPPAEPPPPPPERARPAAAAGTRSAPG